MRKTEWRGLQCPPLYTERLNGGMKQITLYVDIQQSKSDGGTEEWTATAITLPTGVNDYGSIVSAIIDAKYPRDSMDAINNNNSKALYDAIKEISSPEQVASIITNPAVTSWESMQEYRQYAKDVARKVVAAIEAEEEINESEA